MSCIDNMRSHQLLGTPCKYFTNSDDENLGHHRHGGRIHMLLNGMRTRVEYPNSGVCCPHTLIKKAYGKFNAWCHIQLFGWRSPCQHFFLKDAYALAPESNGGGVAGGASQMAGVLA